MYIVYSKTSWWEHLDITIFIVMKNKNKEEKHEYHFVLTTKVILLKTHTVKDPSHNYIRHFITVSEIDSISRNISTHIEKHIVG